MTQFLPVCVSLALLSVGVFGHLDSKAANGDDCGCSTPSPGPTIPCPEYVNLCCSVDACNQALPIPYPNDCTKFCLCDFAGAIEMQCPPGLEFDPNTLTCNWPNGSCDPNWYPECGEDPVPTTTIRTTTLDDPDPLKHLAQ